MDVVRALANAKSDTERVAALTLLPRLAAKLADSSPMLNEIGRTIPLDFLVRILVSKEEKSLYFTIGTQILSLLSRTDSFTDREDIDQVFLQLLESTLERTSGGGGISEECLTDVVYSICLILNAQPRLLSTNGDQLSAILKALPRASNNCALGLSLSRQLLSHDSEAVFVYVASLLSSLNDPASVAAEVFDELEQLLDALPAADAHALWATELRAWLKKAVSARLSAAHSSWGVGGASAVGAVWAPLRAATAAAAAFGSAWFAADEHFLVLLNCVASVELQMLLDRPPNELSGDRERILTMARCCELHELSISFAEDAAESMSEETCLQISRLLRDTVQFVLRYFVGVKEEGHPWAGCVRFPLFRLACSLLAVGGGEMLPAEALDDAWPLLVDAAAQTLDSLAEFDAFDLLLPAAAAQSTPRLVASSLGALLSRYVRAKWPAYAKTPTGSDARAAAAAQLCRCCRLLLDAPPADVAPLADFLAKALGALAEDDWLLAVHAAAVAVRLRADAAVPLAVARFAAVLAVPSAIDCFDSADAESENGDVWLGALKDLDLLLNDKLVECQDFVSAIEQRLASTHSLNAEVGALYRRLSAEHM